MQELLHTILLRSPPNLFDEFTKECQKWYEAPAHTFVEMRTRDNKKIRGDVFEEFCVLYLKHVRGYTNVWRLPDVPEHILGGLSLKRPDMGIDIIAEKDGRYTAVQCKYKKHTSMKPKNILSWKALSTFYALCLRTGPWEKYIVMTNCDYTRHAGKKTPKDVSICLKTFQNTTKEQWTKMSEIEGNKLEEQKVVKKTPEELRQARLAYFSS
jgi:predicted helicase